MVKSGATAPTSSGGTPFWAARAAGATAREKTVLRERMRGQFWEGGRIYAAFLIPRERQRTRDLLRIYREAGKIPRGARDEDSLLDRPSDRPPVRPSARPPYRPTALHRVSP